LWERVIFEKLFSNKNQMEVLMRALAVVLGLFACLVGGCGGGGGGGDDAPVAPVYDFGLFFLQYRVFENTSVGYQAYLPMTKDGNAIQEADITDIRMFNSANNPVTATTEGFNAENYMYLNCTVAPCAQSGPLNDNGFYDSFSSLLADTYSFEVDTADGQTMNLDVPYTGQLVLPFVSSSTMQSSWVGSDLVLNWTNPVGSANWAEVDQLRIRLFDGTGKSILYIRLDPTADTVTINGSLLNQAAGLGNGVLQSWEIQTRAYDANGMNFARGYSNRLGLDQQPIACVGQVIDPINLTIGTPLNQTIEAFGTNFYVFDVVDPVAYTISLYNMVTDNDWTLIDYISNCEDDYPVNLPIIAESSNALTAPDIQTVVLNPGKYLLVVDEYDSLPSSYTVSVTR
jgi:hypothetical protein